MLKNEYIIVDVDIYCLIISFPTIDYNGKMYKPQTNSNNKEWRYFGITNELLITGKYEIDMDESNEDEIVIYYR